MALVVDVAHGAPARDAPRLPRVALVEGEVVTPVSVALPSRGPAGYVFWSCAPCMGLATTTATAEHAAVLYRRNHPDEDAPRCPACKTWMVAVALSLPHRLLARLPAPVHKHSRSAPESAPKAT